jgi:hypothetical protein
MLCLRSATVENLILEVMLEPCKIEEGSWDDQQVPILQMSVEKSLFKYNEYCIIKCCDIIVLYTDIETIWAVSSISEWTCLLALEEWASEKYDFSMFTVCLVLTGILVFKLSLATVVTS